MFVGKTTHFRGAFLHLGVKVGSNKINSESGEGGGGGGVMVI